MSRRILNQSEDENTNKLLESMDKDGKLSDILDLIKGQQQELKSYMFRLEQVTSDIKTFENKKKNLLAEVEVIEKSNANLRQKLNDELKPLLDKIENTNEKLANLEIELKNETQTINEKIKDFQLKTSQEEAKYSELLESHRVNVDSLNEEQELVKQSIDSLNQELNLLREKVTEENSLLNATNEDKIKILDEVEKFKEQKKELEYEVSGLVASIEDLKEKKLKLENKNKETEEDGVLRSEELEKQFQVELQDIEEQKTTKKVQLNKVNDSLTKLNSQYESVKVEYDKITSMIAEFLSKKNEVERKEEIIKKKYKEAGFNW